MGKQAIKFFAFLVLIPFFGFSQVVELETTIYKVVYDQDLEQPLKVTYTVQCPNGGADRAGMDFRTVPNVHTSDNDDYSNTVYDKGHLAPAAAFSCTKEMLRETFFYFNSALQHQSLNRGVWNRLEQFERSLANFYQVDVVIEVKFPDTIERVAGGAAIPKEFVKTIKFGDKVITFVFPNKDTSGTDWIDYLVK
jgi:DNA/RNA endonuclease G (NUC1)